MTFFSNADSGVRHSLHTSLRLLPSPFLPPKMAYRRRFETLPTFHPFVAHFCLNCCPLLPQKWATFLGLLSGALPKAPRGSDGLLSFFGASRHAAQYFSAVPPSHFLAFPRSFRLIESLLRLMLSLYDLGALRRIGLSPAAFLPFSHALFFHPIWRFPVSPCLAFILSFRFALFCTTSSPFTAHHDSSASRPHPAFGSYRQPPCFWRPFLVSVGYLSTDIDRLSTGLSTIVRHCRSGELL